MEDLAQLAPDNMHMYTSRRFNNFDAYRSYNGSYYVLPFRGVDFIVNIDGSGDRRVRATDELIGILNEFGPMFEDIDRFSFCSNNNGIRIFINSNCESIWNIDSSAVDPDLFARFCRCIEASDGPEIKPVAMSPNVSDEDSQASRDELDQLLECLT